ncbi:MAG: Type secretion system domain protein [Mycobacterium sp.]|nr:Type secretion system domain protein [Mycobacterium sp.]
MSPALVGALLGALASVGFLLVWSRSPLARRVRLDDRLEPYLRDAARPSALLARAGAGVSTWGAAGRLLRPLVVDAARAAERVFGGGRAVRRRLHALGADADVEGFRVEQVVWAVAGLLGTALAGLLLGALAGSVDAVAVVFAAVFGGVGGALARDWWLSVEVRRREEAMLAEFPVVADLLALAVTAGEAPAAALDRVCRLCRGELGGELATALGEAHAGAALPVALQSLADRTSLEPLARFVDGIVIALERGTPLAEVLRAQAADVREARKRDLLATGGRREIAMLVPVVFLILPVTVLFAMYPGLASLTLLTR